MGDVELKEEVNPLGWMPLSENFADPDRFAGDQNLAHIMNMALKYPLNEPAINQGKTESIPPEPMEDDTGKFPASDGSAESFSVPNAD